MNRELTCDVIHEVATAKDADPLELPPLTEAVNPDAIDQLFEKPANRRLALQFEYAGCDVTLRSDRDPEIRVNC